MNNNIKEIVYGKDTIEFTTVAVQYCILLENLNEISEPELTDKLIKILPLLYLKATLVPESVSVSDGEEPEITVTEEDYNYITGKLYAVYGKDDTYLEVFLQDMKYSETPIAASITEDLADIYQDLKNYITIFERGIEENMNDALYICIDNFKTYWGQKLVNVLRALHMLRYSFDKPEDEASIINQDQEEDIW